MPRHSFANHRASRVGGPRGWLVGLGLILAVFTGIFTFLLGAVVWSALGLLRALTSPFRAKSKSEADLGPRWSVRVDRPGGKREGFARPPQEPLPPMRTVSGSNTEPKVVSAAGDVQDADFEEIH